VYLSGITSPSPNAELDTDNTISASFGGSSLG
jgi:hypothetical protein